MIRRSTLPLFFVLAGCLALWSCSPDLDGVSAPGQTCTTDADCAEGLVCVQRLCRYGIAPDAGTRDTDGGTRDTDADVDTADTDTGDREDAPNAFDAGDEPDADDPYECTPGETRCVEDDPGRIERCLASGDDGPHWTGNDCADNEICEEGQCIDPDEPDCCPEGCSDDQICEECSCVDYDPSQCTYQNQPCDSEGRITNNFVCTDFGESGQLRCVGLCNPSADDPDSTCTGSGGICFFEETDQPNGFCLQSCSIGDNCADDEMACIYNDSSYEEGVCQPVTEPNEPGAPCNPDDAYSCSDEYLCIGGFCRQSCRPFDQQQSDCQQGACLPFSADLGFCAEDSSTGDGQCNSAFTTCGEDATGCFPGGDGWECRDMCRLAVDDADCDGDADCVQYDDENEQVGSCL